MKARVSARSSSAGDGDLSPSAQQSIVEGLVEKPEHGMPPSALDSDQEASRRRSREPGKLLGGELPGAERRTAACQSSSGSPGASANASAVSTASAGTPATGAGAEDTGAARHPPWP